MGARVGEVGYLLLPIGWRVGETVYFLLAGPRIGEAGTLLVPGPTVGEVGGCLGGTIFGETGVMLVKDGFCPMRVGETG